MLYSIILVTGLVKTVFVLFSILEEFNGSFTFTGKREISQIFANIADISFRIVINLT
jgi:hypothetical protein